MGEGREVNNYWSWNASEPMTERTFIWDWWQLSARYSQNILRNTSMIDLVADCASPVALRTPFVIVLVLKCDVRVSATRGHCVQRVQPVRFSWRQQTTQREMTKTQAVQIRRVRRLLIMKRSPLKNKRIYFHILSLDEQCSRGRFKMLKFWFFFKDCKKNIKKQVYGI